MRYVRRLLGWAIFLGFLGAVGFGVFHVVRSRPRFTIPEVLFIEHLSADGSRMVAIPWHDFGIYHERGPLQVWDTRRGEIVHEFCRAAKEAWFTMSHDRATVAAGLGDGTLWLVDWQSGQASQVQDVDLGPMPHAKTPGPGMNFGFSSEDHWLFAGHGTGKPTYFIDVASKKVLWRSKDHFLWADSKERFVFAWDKGEIEMWDLATASRVAGLVARREDPMIITPDGETLVTCRAAPLPSPGYITQRIDVWDLKPFQLRFQRELSPPGKLEMNLSPDGRTLALWLRQEQFESDLALVDVATGRLLWSYRMKSANAGQFLANGAVWMLQHGVDLKTWTGTLTVFDVATGRVLWQKSGRTQRFFTGTSGILHQEQDAVELLDAATGQRRGAKLVDLVAIQDVTHKMSVRWGTLAESPDGTYFAFRGQRPHERGLNAFSSWLANWWPTVFGDDASTTIVVETATGRQLGALGNVAQHTYWTLLSSDGSTLVTCDVFDEAHRMTRVWDVHSTRAWRWALGATAATGIGLLALRWAWRRRKAHKATKAAVLVPGRSE